jgi:hypothetical protein
MGALLIVAFGFSTSQAQVTFLKGDTTYVPIQHSMSSVGDSLKYKLATISLFETGAGQLLATTGDSLQIKTPANFLFVKDSVVTITSSPYNTLTFDTTGFYAKYGITQTSIKTIKVKAYAETGAGVFYFSINAPAIASTPADTISISGLYVQSVDTLTNLKYDSTSTVGKIAFSQLSVGANSQNLSALIGVPGKATQIAFSVTPNASQTAGYFISTTATGTPTTADSSKGIILLFKDAKGNVTASGVSAPSVSDVLTGQTTNGNGTLAGAGTTHWVYGSDVNPVGIEFYGLTYTKAETIDLKFTFGSSTINTVANGLGSGIAFAPGAAANISVALNVNNHDTITVDNANTGTAYTLTVTDKFFNPVVNGTVISAAENPPHGGSFTFSPANTTTNGSTSVTFFPSKFWIGQDVLNFTSGTVTQPHVITITAGKVGGIIVDASDSASDVSPFTMTVNAAGFLASVGENIAAGKTIYVRGFLRDTYGNPIDATAPLASAITFKITGTNGKNVALGTQLFTTSKISESQYSNNATTAIGVAIPYTVSSNVVIGTAHDSVLVSTGGYSLTVGIQNRSNVPASFKLYQSAGDSSVVASNFGNSITFLDSAWDAYSNPVQNPGAVVVAPLQKSYDLMLSTKGLVKFARTADTTAADTVLPSSSGVYTIKTLLSGKKSGIDTLALAAGTATKWTNVWVTPALYAQLSLTPATVTGTVAGQSVTFTVEKQDAFGNHIDLGLAGGNLRGNSPGTTAPTANQIQTDSGLVVVDTVSSGHNRGGYVTLSKGKTSGKAGVASIGGSLDLTVPFTAYTGGVDTQKVYASLSGFKDTSIVYSIATGLLRAFTAVIAAADSSHFAGDSVLVTFTARDSSGNRIYTYNQSGQTFFINHTSVFPIITKDTTFYFTYINSNTKYVKSTGFGIQDTVFIQGQATLYLHKFTVDSVNTVSVTGNGINVTASQGIRFKPLGAATGVGTWTVTVTTVVNDSVQSTGALGVKITPRDKYYNINTTDQTIVNLASNQTSGFNVGSNPKVVQGITSFNGTLTGATNNLVVFVFNSGNSSIFGQSTQWPISTIITAVAKTGNLPKVYSLSQNYPNPFNPTTQISYQLPKAGLVTLKVYDILGKEVATLVNRNQDAGTYTVPFNAASLASGVYFYRIESNSFVSVKKLMLLK